MYQVKHKLGSVTYIAKQASTDAEPTTFTNPINASRLILASTWYVAETASGSNKRLEICQKDEVTYQPATVVGYGHGGIIKVKFDSSDEDPVWVDLTKEQYRWIV